MTAHHVLTLFRRPHRISDRKSHQVRVGLQVSWVMPSHNTKVSVGCFGNSVFPQTVTLGLLMTHSASCGNVMALVFPAGKEAPRPGHGEGEWAGCLPAATPGGTPGPHGPARGRYVSTFLVPREGKGRPCGPTVSGENCGLRHVQQRPTYRLCKPETQFPHWPDNSSPISLGSGEGSRAGFASLGPWSLLPAS